MEFRINDLKIVATTFLSQLSQKNPGTVYDFIEVNERQFIIKPAANQPVIITCDPMDFNDAMIQAEKERRSEIARRAVATRKANQLKNA